MEGQGHLEASDDERRPLRLFTFRLFLLLASPSTFAPSISSFAKHDSFCRHYRSADVIKQQQVCSSEAALHRFLLHSLSKMALGAFRKTKRSVYPKNTLTYFIRLLPSSECVLDQFSGMMLVKPEER